MSLGEVEGVLGDARRLGLGDNLETLDDAVHVLKHDTQVFSPRRATRFASGCVVASSVAI